MSQFRQPHCAVNTGFQVYAYFKSLIQTLILGVAWSSEFVKSSARGVTAEHNGSSCLTPKFVGSALNLEMHFLIW